MNTDKYIQEYLSKVTKRLMNEGYHINQNIRVHNQDFEYIAKRNSFEIGRFGFFTTFFLFARLATPDINSLKEFSAKSFRYAKKASGIHPPYGLLYGMLCFPVAITNSIGNDTAEAIRKNEFPKHWAAFEKLVVLGLDRMTLYYCELTPSWGAMYHDRDRQLINKILAP